MVDETPLNMSGGIGPFETHLCKLKVSTVQFPLQKSGSSLPAQTSEIR